MSANIKLVNWQGIAESNFTWVGDLWYPTSDVAWKIWLGNRFAMTATWPVDFVAGSPGYDYYVNPYIRIRFWNQVGALVWDLGKWPCWLKNGYTYEFNCVTHVLAEVTTPGVAGTIVEKKLNYGGTDFDFGVTVPLNTSASVKITIRNDSAVSALLKLIWIVVKPDGSEAQYYENQAPYLSPGELLTLQGGFITLNPDGTWSIGITLLAWDGSAWVVVDSWPAWLYGTLCTVAGAPPTESVFSNLMVTYAKL